MGSHKRLPCHCLMCCWAGIWENADCYLLRHLQHWTGNEALLIETSLKYLYSQSLPPANAQDIQGIITSSLPLLNSLLNFNIVNRKWANWIIWILINFFFPPQSPRYYFSLLFNVRKVFCNYGDLQIHFTQVWGEGGRGKENGEEMLFFGRFLTTPRSHQKKDTSSLRGRHFSCSVQCNNNLNTVKFCVGLYALDPSTHLAEPGVSVPACCMTRHPCRKETVGRESGESEACGVVEAPTALLVASQQEQNQESIPYSASISICAFLFSSQRKSFWSCPSLWECQ